MEKRTTYSVRGMVFVVACALVMSLSCAVLEPKANPIVSIVPPSAPVNAAFTVTGSGFKAGEEVIIVLHLEGVGIALGNRKDDMILTDAKGSFTAKSAIPSVAGPGRYKVEVTGNKGSKVNTSLEVVKK